MATPNSDDDSTPLDTSVTNAIEAGEMGALFFTASWCGPCKAIYPVWDEQCAILAKRVPGVRAFKVDVDEYDTLAARFSVRAMPTLMFFANGKVYTGVKGADARQWATVFDCFVTQVACKQIE